VGFSYGGWAATQMAKARPTVVRGIVSIAGGGPQGGGSKDPPVAAMMVHGSNDTAEPPAAGESSRDHFVATNGCAATSQDVEPAPCKAYTGCMAGKPVEWCLHPGVHEVPGFAPPAIWKFFTSLR
jgi:dienelactone hydrolase